MLAVEHEPGEVRLQRVPVLLQEALHVVRHRAGKMFDPAKKYSENSVAGPGSVDFLPLGNRDPGWKNQDRDPTSGMSIPDPI